MRLSDFDYALSDALVARFPTERRDGSRLMHLDPEGRWAHRRFPDVLELLRPGDVLVTNDTAVLAARMEARKLETGGRVEVLLVEPLEAGGPDGRGWRAMLGASKRVRSGAVLALGEDRLRVVEDEGEGLYRLQLSAPAEELAARHGALPIPPYLGRAPTPDDAVRYQTVYADPSKRGSVAAPTAGLHFTPALLDALEARGIERVSLTLHVGPGTFLPVRGTSVEEHRMHAERFEVPAATAEAVERASAEGRRVVAVGTTSTRVLESFRGAVRPGKGSTDLFLRPGSTFHRVDAMITNFHLPRSTLIMLVAALAGRERVLAAYEEAVRERYRFYSYGDAMLVEKARAR